VTQVSKAVVYNMVAKLPTHSITEVCGNLCYSLLAMIVCRYRLENVRTAYTVWKSEWQHMVHMYS